MLNELKKLPPIRLATDSQPNPRRNNRLSKRNVSTNSRQQVQHINSRRKSSSSNPVQEVNTSTLSNETTSDELELNNPIALLLRIQQNTKRPEPVFTMIEERTQNHRKQFVMEVSHNDLIARGAGGNKKQAKREAAKAMLSLLGYGDANNSTVVPSIPIVSDKMRRSKFNDSKVLNESNGQSLSRQLPPGVLLMKSPENNKSK